MDQELYKKAEDLQNYLVGYATSDNYGSYDYQELRTALLSNPITKDLVPNFVKKSRDIGQFWAFIKHKFAHYQERRTFLWDEFRPLLEKIETLAENPVSESMESTLKNIDIENVKSIWMKITKRREEDPEGAITAARSMLESVCKYILDEMNITYSNKIDLPELYKMVAKNLNLAPDQYTEEIFKQILGGVQSVVQGLGALRNKLGDAHGKGKGGPKPNSRHAELAINMAGSISLFLLETFNARGLNKKEVFE